MCVLRAEKQEVDTVVIIISQGRHSLKPYHKLKFHADNNTRNKMLFANVL